MCGLIVEGTKFEKSVGKVLGLVVIVNLIVSVLSLSLNLKSGFAKVELKIDTEYVESINSYKLSLIKEEITNKLRENGIVGCGIYFSTSFVDNQLSIEKIHVDLTLSEYGEGNVNINTVKKLVTEIVDIDKENVVVHT